MKKTQKQMKWKRSSQAELQSSKQGCQFLGETLSEITGNGYSEVAKSSTYNNKNNLITVG